MVVTGYCHSIRQTAMKDERFYGNCVGTSTDNHLEHKRTKCTWYSRAKNKIEKENVRRNETIRK